VIPRLTSRSTNRAPLRCVVSRGLVRPACGHARSRRQSLIFFLVRPCAMRLKHLRITRTSVALTACFLCSCATDRPHARTAQSVQIISSPPGARIEVNGNYVGDAPCTLQIPSFAEGRFREHTTIRAIPIRGGDYTQSKIFFGYAAFDNPYLISYRIPERIFFDMRLGPANPEIDVNVR